MRRRFGTLVIIAAAIALLAPVAMAADKEAEEDTSLKIIKITLHPTPAPRPALKYQLLPPLVDRRPGNAVTQYLKAPHEYANMYSDTKFWDTLRELMRMPLPELRKERTTRGGLPFCEPIGSEPNGMMEQFDIGARCESCDWAMPIRDYDYDPMLLAEIQDQRQPAWILAVRARLQIADGKYDEAIRTLQTGYSFGRHVAQGPFTVQCLVGAAIVGVMSEQVEAFVQQPGAPNLYWALAALPRPMVDCRMAFEAEMGKPYLAHPELRDLDNNRYLPEQWQQLLQQNVDRWLQLAHSEQTTYTPPTEAERHQTLKMLLDGYPDAKRHLIARGHSAAEVEAMPTAQAVLLNVMQTYDEVRDDLFKWLWMPFPEALQRVEQARKRLGDSPLASPEVGHLADNVGGLLTTKRASARFDRNIAALQILEAIRMYGAAHDGKLPNSLADITEVPIPSDPLRGEPFLYRREGDSAMLESPYPAPLQTLRYQIQFARDGANP